MKVHVEMKSYDILRNNHCLNRWVKYFYECELFKKSLPSHKLDPRKQRYDLTDPHDQALFEQKKKILYAKFVEGLSRDYSNRKVLMMKKKVIKLDLKMLRAMYLISQNKKIYRYAQRFANHSGYQREVYDVDTQGDV